ncbi:hypothetical protein GE21DRAFT_1269412 [Neurospora crassa]|nr:hypothetical protein GE21DRAFT_1269412 [Neurospora crassa]
MSFPSSCPHSRSNRALGSLRSCGDNRPSPPDAEPRFACSVGGMAAWRYLRKSRKGPACEGPGVHISPGLMCKKRVEIWVDYQSHNQARGIKHLQEKWSGWDSIGLSINHCMKKISFFAEMSGAPRKLPLAVEVRIAQLRLVACVVGDQSSVVQLAQRAGRDV